ncbi:hypothetical protein PUN28_010323 [Cardiocondyla obscurior]|uniref:Large ribosomal subunit protein bL36m n=1 Tax=Cardiocondyla obscurior TaxID=286306 RepID=A0AAW2FTD4_9HYME
MNTGSILRSAYQAVNSVIPRVLITPSIHNVSVHRIHYMANGEKLSLQNNLLSHKTGFFLQPVLPMYNSICGLKAKGKLQLRCKDCYYMCKDETWFVLCKTHPRHKQVKIKKKEYKTWILTWASQSKIRGW